MIQKWYFVTTNKDWFNNWIVIKNRCKKIKKKKAALSTKISIKPSWRAISIKQSPPIATKIAIGIYSMILKWNSSKNNKRKKKTNIPRTTSVWNPKIWKCLTTSKEWKAQYTSKTKDSWPAPCPPRKMLMNKKMRISKTCWVKFLRNPINEIMIVLYINLSIVIENEQYRNRRSHQNSTQKGTSPLTQLTT